MFCSSCFWLTFGPKCGLFCFCSACHVGSDSACMPLHIYDSFAKTTEAAGAEVVVFFETLSKNWIADEAAVNDFLQGRIALLGGIGFVRSNWLINSFKWIIKGVWPNGYTSPRRMMVEFLVHLGESGIDHYTWSCILQKAALVWQHRHPLAVPVWLGPDKDSVNCHLSICEWFWHCHFLSLAMSQNMSWKLWVLPRTLKEMLQPVNDDQGDEKKNDKKKDLKQEEPTTYSWRPAKKAGNKMFLHFIQVVKMKANIILLVFVQKGRGRVRHGQTVRVRAFQV